MATSPVFLDTFALIALTDRSDQWHTAATKCSHQLVDSKRRRLTTDWVLTEYLGKSAKPPLRGVASGFIRQLLSQPAV